MSELPREFVDARISEALALLKKRHQISLPITEGEAMQYAQYAYTLGYLDHLAGISPESERSKT